jgi:hypothetical protein
MDGDTNPYWITDTKIEDLAKGYNIGFVFGINRNNQASKGRIN